MAQRFTIEADNPLVENKLEELFAIISREGGEIHPQLTIRQSGNDISTLSSLGRGSLEPVLKIPRHCLPDQGHFSMAAQDNDIVLTNVTSDCPPLERELQECMIEIYNLTDKIEAQLQGDPKIVLRDDPELLDYLHSARPAKHALHAKNSDKPEQYHAVRDFLMSRILKHKSGKPGDDVDRAYLMPFVDYLNHHPQGAPYRLVGDGDSSGWLVSPNCKPDPSSRECYACYGQHYDPLDLFLSYNFVDVNSPQVGLRSVPLSLDFEGLGTVRVGAEAATGIKTELPQAVQDLRFWIPKMYKPADGKLDASHLLLPHSDAPLALRRTLGIMVINLGGKSGAVDGELVVEAERQVIEKNEQYYQQLSELAAKRTVTDRNRQVLELIGSLAELQLGFIKGYRDRINARFN